MKRSQCKRNILGRITALLLMAAMLFSLIPAVPAKAANTYTFLPNGEKYLSWTFTKVKINMPTDGVNYQRTVDASTTDCAARQKDYFHWAMLIYRVLNGTGNIDIWNNYACAELKAAYNGKVQFSDRYHIPNVWYFNTPAGQQILNSSGGITGISRANWISILRDHRYYGTYEVNNNATGVPNLTTQMLGLQLKGERTTPRLMRIDGEVAYCLQVNLTAPSSGTTTEFADSAYITKYNAATSAKVRNIMYYGYPNNKYLPAEYANLPADAMEQATQLAIWKVMDGTNGNTQTTTANFQTALNNGTHTMISNKNPKVTGTAAVYTQTLAYYNYLISMASADWSPSIEDASLSNFVEDGNDYKATLSFSSDKVSSLSVSISPSLPSGSTVNGAAATNSFTLEPTDGTNTVEVRIPKANMVYDQAYSMVMAADTKYGSYLYSTSDSSNQDMAVNKQVVRAVSNVPTVPPVKKTSLNISVEKTEDGTNTPLSGAEFTVYTDAACTSIATDVLGNQVILTTGTDGKATSTQLAEGVYYIKETKPAAGYVLGTNVTASTMDLTDGVSKTYAATNKQKKILISKKDTETGHYLPGAVLALYNSSEEEVARWTSGSDAKELSKIPAGTYTLKELSAPFGYQLAEPMTVTVNNTEETQELPDFYNDETFGKLIITKIDSFTRDPMPGVIFALKYKNDVRDANDAVIHRKGEIWGEEQADENGQIIFEHVPIGVYGPNGWVRYIDYVLEESVTPNGYVKAATVDIRFNYVNSSTPEILVEKEVENQKDIRIRIWKHDGSTNQPIEGAEFTVYEDDLCSTIAKDLNGNEVFLVTGNGGQAVSGPMAPGRYYIKETLLLPGYYFDSDMTYEADLTQNESADVEIPNYPTKTKISKRDPSFTTNLRGARMGIYDKTGTTLLHSFTTTNDEDIIQKLDVSARSSHGDEYILRELEAPFGYQRAADVRFTVENSGDIQEIDPVIDPRTFGRLTVLKTNEDTGEKMQGVRFELRYKADVLDHMNVVVHRKGEVYASGTTDKNGRIIFTGIPIGVYGPNGWLRYIDYELVEAETPDHYDRIDPVDIRFTYVNDTTPVISVTKRLTNKQNFDISVTKKIEGNMGNKTETFNFELELTGDDLTDRELFYMDKDGQKKALTLTDGKFSFSLSHNESVTFINIPYGTTYAVRETDAGREGYRTSIKVNNETTDAASGTLEENKEIVVTNAKNMIIPTGVYNFGFTVPVTLLLLPLLYFSLSLYWRRED